MLCRDEAISPMSYLYGSRVLKLPLAEFVRDGTPTCQKADGTNEGLSLEANARTGADAAMAPCMIASYQSKPA